MTGNSNVDLEVVGLHFYRWGKLEFISPYHLFRTKMCLRWAAAIVVRSLFFIAHMKLQILDMGFDVPHVPPLEPFQQDSRAVVAFRSSPAFHSGQMHLRGKNWRLASTSQNYLLQRKMIEGEGIAVLASDSVFHLGTSSCHPPVSEKYFVSQNIFFRIWLLGG